MAERSSLQDDVDRVVALRQEQQARRSRELVDLLHERAELRGVHAMADLVSDQAAWCA